VELNAAGDLIVDDPEAMRAIASPERLDLLERVRRGRPVEESDGPHLEELERLGFVTREGDHWSPVGRGIYFEAPGDPRGQEAARALTKAMLLREADRPRHWVEHEEAKLTPEWAKEAGMFNARVALSPAELQDVQAEVERVMEPYILRVEAPDEAAPVRVLAYFLPEPVTLEPGSQSEPGS
jgi:hypothetical protein